MSKLIEQAKFAADAIMGGKTRISSDLKEILKEVATRKEGVIIEIPFKTEVNGEYMDSVTVVVTKVTKERIYFINPAKVAKGPCEIKENENKGPARRVEEDGMESMALADLLKLGKTTPILGIVQV